MFLDYVPFKQMRLPGNGDKKYLIINDQKIADIN